VLRDFPDADLADSLCILLELEAAAPEVLSAAIDKLDLPAERRDAVLPLIDARLRGDSASDAPDPQAKEREIDRFARKLVRVEATGKDFSDFSAFDLSLDEQTTTAIAAVQDTIDKTDLPAAQLGCLSSLVRLESSTTIVDALLGRALVLFGELERRGQMNDWRPGRHCRNWPSSSRGRPDVADAISNALVAFLCPRSVSPSGSAQAWRRVTRHLERSRRGVWRRRRSRARSPARRHRPAVSGGHRVAVVRTRGPAGARARARTRQGQRSEETPSSRRSAAWRRLRGRADALPRAA
jgi:hypothetical protein